VFIGVTLAWTAYDSFWKFSVPCWFTAGISGSYSSGFTSLSGRESVSGPQWLLLSTGQCWFQPTMPKRYQHLLFRYRWIIIFFNMKYRMYSISAACGISINSNEDTPIACLYFWFGKYATNKPINAWVLMQQSQKKAVNSIQVVHLIWPWDGKEEWCTDKD